MGNRGAAARRRDCAGGRMNLLDKTLAKVQVRAAPPIITQSGLALSQFADDTPTAYGDYLATSNDVYSAAWLRAKMLAKLPWQTTVRGEIAENHPFTVLMDNPNPRFSGQRLKLFIELCMSTWGQVFLVIEGGRREIWPVKPTLMSPVPDADQLWKGFLFHPPDGGKPIPFGLDEVVWLAYPDPLNSLSALAPMAAARLAAEVAGSAQKANRALFTQGFLGGGFVFPPDGATLDRAQAEDLERVFDQRFKGVDKAHRWVVMQHAFKTQSMTVSPKDAQFIDGMNLSFRQVCRALGVPPALVGDAEFATLANLRVYERMFWEHTGEFEAIFVAEEINRVLSPRFGGAEIGLSLDDVVALQEDESERWSREKEQLELGAIVINEWREGEGLDSVAWGDEPVKITVSNTPPVAERGVRQVRDDTAALSIRGKVDDLEDDLREVVAGLFQRQRDDVIRHLKAGGDPEVPFEQLKWDAKFAEALEEPLFRIMESAFDQASTQVRGTRSKSELRRKATLKAGKIAGNMNTTTFKELRLKLRKALEDEATNEDLVSVVDEIMEKARRVRARMVAETEATGAVTEGQLDAWAIPGTEIRKRWVTAGDEKVRDTHVALNGRTAALDENFLVGQCEGPGPGQTGCVGEDIRCRCVLAPVLAEPRSVNGSDWSDMLEALK